MEGGKPLIFIKPYTKTLAKLKEVLEESSEQQGTEIYEIEDLQEAIQLIPQIGQSLVIAAHPRKTAMLLQASRAHIKKLQTKVLLISPKPIPRRTIDKFMKIGLTECIVEPIVPKTLQYKVNLLIRSIVIKKEESSFEKKFDADAQSTDDSEIEIKEMQRKMREGLEAAQDSSREEAGDEEDFYKKKEKNYREEEIAGYYKGKMKRPDSQEDEEEEEESTSNSENHIEGYYKGSLKKSETGQEEADSDDDRDLDIEDDDVHALASKVNLLLDDDEEQEKKTGEVSSEETPQKIKTKAPALSIEEEQERSLKKQLEEATTDLDDVASHHLDLIDDLSDSKQETAQETEAGQETKKPSAQLNIEEEARAKKKRETSTEKVNEARKKSANLDIEEEDLYASKEKHVKEDKERADKKTVSLEVSDDAETAEEREEAEQAHTKDKKKSVSIDLEAEQSEKARKDTDQQEDDIHEKKAKVQIDVEEDLYSREDKQEAQQANEDSHKKSAKKLDIENDLEHDYGEAKRKKKEARDREVATNLDVEDDSDRNRKRAPQEDDNYQTRSSGYTENIQDRGGNSADAHSDKIQTHYDSRKGIKHGDDEWQATEREQQFDDNWKRTKNNEFIMPEKEAFGEQTIDYSDLKKQFDAIEYDLSGKKKVGEFEDKAPEAKALGFAAAISASAESSDEQQEEQDSEVQDDNERPIQEAHLKTGPTLVKSLRLYLVSNLDREKVLKGILELLRDDLGVLVAIKYGKGPHDGKLKTDTFDGWLDEETKNSILSQRASSTSCPLLPTYSDKTFEQNKTTFYYPFTEGIATFAWAECYLPAGTDEEGLKGIEAVLESARGTLLDEFHELGGTGPYAELRKKEAPQEGAGAKVLGFFGKLFGKKKAS